MTKIKSTNHINKLTCWWWYGTNEIFIHWWQGCKMIEPFWKTARQDFFKWDFIFKNTLRFKEKLSIELHLPLQIIFPIVNIIHYHGTYFILIGYYQLKSIIYSDFIFFFLVGLGFELKALYLQNRLSNAWTTPPVHFVLIVLEMGVTGAIYPSNQDPTSLSLSIS
jgi:hypothetical protein